MSYEPMKDQLPPAPASCSARLLSLDLAMIRWSVRCRTWQEMSAGSQPELGPFLAGWFCRCSGIGLSIIEADHAFRDSFRIGWREAADCISIEEQKHPDPEIERLNQVVAEQADLIAGAVVQLRKLRDLLYPPNSVLNEPSSDKRDV